MQTFLPYSSFEASAAALDYRRLGKQRVECKQILKALRTGSGWVNHPATKMWCGYEEALAAYMNACIREWVSRGYRNTMEIVEVPDNFDLPPWLGDPAFHASHQEALVRKSCDFYGDLGWPAAPEDEPMDQIYWWPVLREDGTYYLKKKDK